MSDAAIQQVIASLVPEGARVLDLGCGDGALMQRLMRERGCTGYGIEIDDAKVLSCVQRGVNVLQLNLHEGLADFGDQSFDAVLQIDTLQHLRNAETMLCETARVGRVGIIAFPNFAHWPNRLAVLRGRMPAACPTSGTTRPTSAWAPSRTLKSSPAKTACKSSTPSACTRAAPCAACPTCWRARRFSKSRAAENRPGCAPPSARRGERHQKQEQIQGR